MFGFLTSDITRRNFGMYSLQWGHQVAKNTSSCTFLTYLFILAMEAASGA